MRWGFKGADNQIIIIETFEMNDFSSSAEMFSISEFIRFYSNQFRLVCVWVCLMMKMQLTDTAHFAQPKWIAAFRLSFVIYVPFNWHSQCSYFQYGWCLLMHFFLLNYDICVRHLCRFYFSNSFFSVAILKRNQRKVVSMYIVRSLALWIFEYLFIYFDYFFTQIF